MNKDIKPFIIAFFIGIYYLFLLIIIPPYSMLIFLITMSILLIRFMIKNKVHPLKKVVLSEGKDKWQKNYHLKKPLEFGWLVIRKQDIILMIMENL